MNHQAEQVPASIQALTNISTRQRNTPVNRRHLEPELAPIDPLVMFILYFQRLAYYEPLKQHRDWFNKTTKLDVKMLMDDSEISNSDGFRYLEEQFRLPDGQSSYLPEQDPKTKLNFFRGNFHVKVIGFLGMAMLDTSPGPGYQGSLKEWLAPDYDLVAQAIEDYRVRISLRKSASGLSDELEKRINLFRDEPDQYPLSREELLNYYTRIAEAEKIAPVPIDEIDRSFSVVKLCLNFFLMKSGQKQLSDEDRAQLIQPVILPLVSPMPEPTPPLDPRKYQQQEILVDKQ